MSGVKRGKDILVGYILPEKRVVRTEDDAEAPEDSEEEKEEERQPEFLDMGEMTSVSSGGQMFQSSAPLRNQVEFMEILSGKTYKVEGRFAFRSPWWELTCSVRCQQTKLLVKGYPSYKLRTDLDREGWRGIISLFLTACNIEPTFITQFCDWLPENREVTIHNLVEAVGEFSEEGDCNVAAAQSITACLSHSAEGMRVHASSLYPHVMKYLPTLLPAHFAELLGKGKRRKTLPATQATQTRPTIPTNQQEDEEDGEEEGVDLSLLAKLEDIITTDVWKLGFNYLVYKELKLVRCEAQLRAFMDCDLLRKIPLLQRNALWVYEQLKNYCHRTGSTYSDKQALCEDLRRKPGMSDEQAWDAIQFLREHGIVVCDKQKVMLQNFHSYETGIAKCLRSLVYGAPWKIPLNAREVLNAAAEERRRLKTQGMDSAQATTHPDENDESNRAVPDPTNTSLPLSHGEESEANTHPDPTSESSEQWAGPGQAGAEQVLPPIELDPDQVRAAEMICANPVTVISGKGGCGKTTVVSLLFRAALLDADQKEIKNACMDFENDTGGSQGWEDPPGSPSFLPQLEEEEEESRTIRNENEILLTAPIGRAASLLTKRTGFTAYTMHQVVWSFMTTKKDEEGCPEDWKFQHVRVLVVDEGSLVCVQLLHSILTMLTKHADLKKFIILGDVRQLPSIQPGKTLHDLYHCLKPVQWAIEMRTNHRAESELIVKNAGLISEMGMKRWFGQLEFDATVDLNGSYSMPSADKKFILIRLPREESYDDLQKAIKLLVDAAPGLKEDSTSQFIAFKRVDVALINELCCKHYNNHTTKNDKNKLAFQTGDKVCCTKNGIITIDEGDADGEDEEDNWKRESFIEASMTNDGRSQKKLRLCNGEIFFIRQDKTVFEAGGSASRRARRKRSLTLDDGDGRVFTVDYRELQRVCRLQHAWARTIHTFQGSENETIVYVLGNGSAQTWKHVYTAVTRGQKRVYVVAMEDGMKLAISRRETPRNTRLESLVRELLVQPANQPGDSQPHPATPHRTAPGFSPRQSTPLSPETPSRPQTSEENAETQPNGATTSPSSKRTWAAEDMQTPRKQLRTESFQSPLGCSPLRKLFLSTPQGKRLFKD